MEETRSNTSDVLVAMERGAVLLRGQLQQRVGRVYPDWEVRGHAEIKQKSVANPSVLLSLKLAFLMLFILP